MYAEDDACQQQVQESSPLRGASLSAATRAVSKGPQLLPGPTRPAANTSHATTAKKTDFRSAL